MNGLLRYGLFLLATLAEVIFSHLSWAQADSLVDVCPLSVGSQWTYRYESSVWDNSDVTVTDSGVVREMIVGRIVEVDSIRWLLRETRTLVRRVHYWPGSGPDTTYPVIDSSNLQIIERTTGRHRLYRAQSDVDIWSSVFPWSWELTDTTVIQRYAPCDSAGEFKYFTHASGAQWAHIYDFTFKQAIGPSQITSRTGPSIVGVLYNSSHTLIDAIVVSAGMGQQAMDPEICRLEQNYPNPFNPLTSIAISLRKSANVRLRVFNLLGQSVASLFDGELLSGVHTIHWNAFSLPSGVYFYVLEGSGPILVRKALLLK